MRVLVSGGTGIVGRFIVEDLLGHGYAVTVGGRTPPADGLFSKPVEFVPLVLDPERDQIEAFDDIYYFVHAAFDHVAGKYRGGEGEDPHGFRTRNLDGSVRLFEAAKDAGVRRACFLSSRAAYGPHPPGMPLTEDLHCRPETLYGTVKLCAERSLQSLCGHGFVTSSLRVTGVYGAARPGQTHKWQQLFDDYLDGRPIEPRAGTEVHGADVASAVRLMLEADAIRINGETFNVSDRLIDRRDILSIVQNETGCPHPLPAETDAADYPAMGICKIAALGWAPGGWGLLERTIGDLVEVAAPLSATQVL